MSLAFIVGIKSIHDCDIYTMKNIENDRAVLKSDLVLLVLYNPIHDIVHIHVLDWHEHLQFTKKNCQSVFCSATSKCEYSFTYQRMLK
jgi:hypothetical protein